MQLRHLKAAIAWGIAFMTSASLVHADFISNIGYAYTTVSYERSIADSLGVETIGFVDWFNLGKAEFTDGASAASLRINSPFGSTEARAYAVAQGYAETSDGTNSASESATAYAGSYLLLYNANPFDVLIPITTYHKAGAETYSNAEYNGYSFAESQSYFYLFNAYGTSVLEWWWAKAISAGHSGTSGPFESLESFHYDVVLTPGMNGIGVAAYVDSYGFVSVPSPVPEPGTVTLAAFGFVGLAAMSRRRRYATDSARSDSPARPACA